MNYRFSEVITLKLSEKVAELKKSEIYILSKDKSVLGFRLKLFDLDTDKFVYYDFDVDLVTRPKDKEFINSLAKRLERMELHLDATTDLLVTDYEVENNIIIQSFEDESALNRSLDIMERVYKVRG